MSEIRTKNCLHACLSVVMNVGAQTFHQASFVAWIYLYVLLIHNKYKVKQFNVSLFLTELSDVTSHLRCARCVQTGALVRLT